MKTIHLSPHVTIFQSALYQTNATLIDLENAVILFDPCWLPEEIKTIQTAVKNILNDRPLYLVFTHNDYDHIMGAGAFPQAIVIASKRFAQPRDAEKERVLAQMKAFDDSYYIQRPYPLFYPTVDQVISTNGQKLALGSATLTFYLSPGHTPDGLFIVVEPLGIFLVGDYLSDIEFPFIYGSYKAYQETLNLAKNIVSQYQINVLVPGHGKPSQSISDMQTRLADSIDYLKRLSEGDPTLDTDLQKQYPFYASIEESHRNNKNKIL